MGDNSYCCGGISNDSKSILIQFQVDFLLFCTLVLCWNGDYVEIENAADNDDIYDGDCERCDFDDDDDVASMHHWCPPIYLQVSAPSAVFVCCLGINHLPKPLTLTTSLGSPSFCLCIFILSLCFWSSSFRQVFVPLWQILIIFIMSVLWRTIVSAAILRGGGIVENPELHNCSTSASSSFSLRTLHRTLDSRRWCN